MSRLLKISLVTVLGFIGGLLAAFGARFWFTAHRTTETIFDVAQSNDPNGVLFDYPSDWIDKGFLLHRVVAVIILLFGVVIFSWAAKELLRNPNDSTA